MAVEHQKSVFISYSHRDDAFCRNLAANLRTQNIKVFVDHDSINAGDGLTTTINNHIVETDFTICIISESSLQSPWVIWEIKQVLNNQDLKANIKILPVFIDRSFESLDKIQNILEHSSKQIEDLDQRIKQGLDGGMAIDDLNANRKNWLKLKQELPEIISFLRSTKLADFHLNNFENGFAELFYSITGQRDLISPLISDYQVSNASYTYRYDTVEQLVMEDDLLTAATRAMDLIKEFFPSNRSLQNKIRVLKGSITRIEKSYLETKQVEEIKFKEAYEVYHEKKDELALSLLELIPLEYSYVA